MSSAASVVTVAEGPGALERALASGADWLWLLGAGARPRDDALERLLAAVEPEGAARAALLAGLVVDDRGVPLDDSLQPVPRGDPAEAIRLLRQRLLPIRSAPFANCLVARDAFDRHGQPDIPRFGAHAPLEWSARVLRDEAGYLVPASEVVMPPPNAPAGRRAALADLLATLRMLPTGAWTRGDAARALAAAAAGGLSPAGPRRVPRARGLPRHRG